MEQKDRYIIVNYHYVRDPSPEWGGIWPCSPAEFERQIRFLKNDYTMLSLRDLYAAAQKELSGKYAAITFDDGLKDQYKHAAPILKRYNVPAAFFIITSTLGGTLPAAHKIHVLLSRVDAEKLIDLFNEAHKAYLISKNKRISKTKRLFESVPIANFKETMIAAPRDLRDKFLSRCFRELGLDETSYARQMFMDEREIKDISSFGFEVGSHSHWHYFGDDAGKEHLKKDALDSIKILRGVTGAKPITFSYPHGRYGEVAAGVLKDAGFSHAVTIEARALGAGDKQYFIPRFDTNDLKKFMECATNYAAL